MYIHQLLFKKIVFIYMILFMIRDSNKRLHKHLSCVYDVTNCTVLRLMSMSITVYYKYAG